MDAMTTMTKWQDQYFTVLKKVEEPVLKVAGEVADRVARYVPERPSFMTSIPTMTEVVDNQLKFRRRLVDEQAAFVHKMMKAMDPVMMKVDHVAPKTPAAKGMHEEMRMPNTKAAHKAA